MPDEKVRDETDGNPATEYEDTTPHERIGYRILDNHEPEPDPESSSLPRA